MGGNPSAVTGRPKPLFGRAEIREGVLGKLDAARSGTGGFLLLVGEGGVGKSTVLRTAIADARERGFVVLESQALPSDLPQPFAVIQDLIRSPRKDEAPAAGGDGAPDASLPLLLAPLETDVKSENRPIGFFEARPWTESEDRLLALLAGPPERIEESRIQLHDRLAGFFTQLSLRDPLVLAVDDLEFADGSSLEFIREFARGLPERRILVLATTVPENEAPPRSKQLLTSMSESSGVSRLTIRRLTETELPEYVRWLMGGREPNRDAIVRWFTQTEGNPLFVEQIVRGTMGYGPQPPVGRPEASLRDLEEVLRERVRALSQEDRRVLVYGAVLGKEFDFPTLRAAAGIDEEPLAEGLDRLVRGGLLREKGGEIYEFVREAVRAEAYGALTETRRRILHRKAALALEQNTRGTGPAIFELARQFYLAHDDTKALDYNRRAADLASAAYAYDTTIIHLQRALECSRRLPLRDPATDLRVMIELGRILDDFGDLHRAEEVLREAVSRARSDPGLEPELGLALLWLARNLQNEGLNADARHLAEEAFQIFERRENLRGILVSHRVLGIASMRLGDFPDAERHHREEVRLAEQEGDERERGHSLIDLGNTLITQTPEKTEEALRLYNQAGEIFQSTKDYGALARVHMNRSLVYHHMGRPEEALRDITFAGEAAERSGSRIWMGYCALNESQFRAELGQIDRAKAAIDRARHIMGPLGDQLADQQMTMIEGMIAEGAQRFRDANERFEVALRMALALKLKAETSEMHFRLAHLAFSQGHKDRARELLKTAVAAQVFSLRADLTSQIEQLQRALDT